jgi:hypothetical protein
MYMGCRFVRKMPRPEIPRIAGRHCDVLSVNAYSLYPERGEFQAWHDAAGRPIVIGEHDLPLRSERQVLPVWRAFTAAERREFHEKYVREWATTPFSLGCHWFQFADQPLTGRSGNGENQPVGFVDITDRPHAELVASARECSERMYAWHAASR